MHADRSRALNTCCDADSPQFANNHRCANTTTGSITAVSLVSSANAHSTNDTTRHAPRRDPTQGKHRALR
jgi:hypothetical protein